MRLWAIVVTLYGLLTPAFILVCHLYAEVPFVHWKT